MSSELEQGDLVRSVAGRDAGQVYAVVGFVEDGRVLVSEGDRRTLRRPKRKNRRHLVKVGRLEAITASRLQCRRARDEEIKKSIGDFCAILQHKGAC